MDSTTGKIVSLSDIRKQADKSEKLEQTESEQSQEKAASSDEESFLDVMRRNEAVQERLRKERNKANRSVLRSYRIKN